MAKQAVPVRVGDTLDLKLEALVGGGEAIARLDGFPIFVPLGVPGDRVRAKIVSTKPGYARAVVDAVITEGPERVAARCPLFGTCGGCQWQELDYERQLHWKREQVADALRRIGGFEVGDWLEPTLGMGDPWDYRNKVHWAIAKEGPTYRIGMYEPRSHRVVDVNHCHIQHPLNNEVLAFLHETLPRFGFEVYDEKTQRGWLRSAFAKAGHQTGELMIGLVTTRAAFPQAEAWVEAVRERFPHVVSIVQNVHAKPGNTLMGDETRVLWGKDHLTEQIGPLKFAISARSFFQVNSEQVEQLYALAADYLALRPEGRAADLYSGTGTIALYLASRGAGEVVGIEAIPEATRDAQANAARNGITNVRFETGKVEERLPRLLATMGPLDGVVLDPPRKGCEPEVLAAIAKTEVPRLVYVSCNPATLARDLKILAEQGGYRLVRARPVDMFPQTAHVETVALLERPAG
ncbi:23S rRNA (uracil(1939)-C(5))-methyltransferase RlmD [bacterium]|nr:23S rRNA (uracil(1939)-C(5))-methyltransferase RlmD [bacterium]